MVALAIERRVLVAVLRVTEQLERPNPCSRDSASTQSTAQTPTTSARRTIRSRSSLAGRAGAAAVTAMELSS